MQSGPCKSSTRSLALAVVLVLALGACASYTPRPLDVSATAKDTPGQLRHAEALPAALSLDELGRLAIDNNPDLVAVRAQRAVAQAQLRAAGTLPNPVLGAGYARVLNGAGGIPAITASISQDLKALVTLGAKRKAAHAEQQALEASIVWQEWQVAAKAQLTAVEVLAAEAQLARARDNERLWSEAVQRDRDALARHDVTMTALALDASAQADAQLQAATLATTALLKRQELNALLGLAPAATLALAPLPPVAPIDPASVRARVDDIVRHRPDLAALQLGYQAQEEMVRAAVLSQFPLMSIGASYGRDTGNVKTLGPDLSFELPIFDRNRAGISREQATRAQLHAEFQARLIAAKSEVAALLAQQAQTWAQREEKRRSIAQTDALAPALERALARQDIDARAWIEAVAMRNAKRQELAALEATLAAQNLAIGSLVGLGMPVPQAAADKDTKIEEAP